MKLATIAFVAALTIGTPAFANPLRAGEQLITIPKDVLQNSSYHEANYCFNDATGAVVCEYRAPELIPAPKATAPLPRNVPSKTRRRQLG